MFIYWGLFSGLSVIELDVEDRQTDRLTHTHKKMFAFSHRLMISIAYVRFLIFLLLYLLCFFYIKGQGQQKEYEIKKPAGQFRVESSVFAHFHFLPSTPWPPPSSIYTFFSLFSFILFVYLFIIPALFSCHLPPHPIHPHLILLFLHFLTTKSHIQGAPTGAPSASLVC